RRGGRSGSGRGVGGIVFVAAAAPTPALPRRRRREQSARLLSPLPRLRGRVGVGANGRQNLERSSSNRLKPPVPVFGTAVEQPEEQLLQPARHRPGPAGTDLTAVDGA